LKSAPFSPPNMNNFSIFCPSQFQNPQSGGLEVKEWANNQKAVQVEKNILVFQDPESLMLLSKKLLFSTQAGHPLIHLNLCQATLSFNLRSKD